MINVRIANISPKVTKILPIPPKSKEFKENFTIGIVIEYKVPNGYYQCYFYVISNLYFLYFATHKNKLLQIIAKKVRLCAGILLLLLVNYNNC